MMIINKKKEIVKKIIKQFEEEKALRESLYPKQIEEDFQKYREYIKRCR
ncbi:hypothetical protein [Fusobacterium perfoetens]|nr:hypothetical protein [Fusobacterium perfoetens]MCI6152048.1 hypothetical protein [Fusobacterium perfoetens]MDY3238061.1 hypothetical protein [Fusobacterium perfoetens]